MSAVLTAARRAVTRRRVQTVVIAIVVLFSSATGVLAVGLLVASHAPFDTAFAQARGAHVTATFAGNTPGLAATGHASGVTAAAGPFDETTASVSASGPLGTIRLPTGTIVGRAAATGPVDQLSLDSGSWLTGPGQIVLARDYAGPLADFVGSTVTVQGSGSPMLRLVGVADSVTGTAQAWVWPSQSDLLHPSTGTAAEQMLYRFDDASSQSTLDAELATATAGLPHGALLASSSYLTVRASAARDIAPFVPFVVAFAVLGIVLSVLITANIVNGAVVAGTRTIGVLKSLGFTPAQVVSGYVAQVLAPALVGCAIGVPVGVVLAQPVLDQTRRAYNLPAQIGGVPLWVMLLVAAGVPLVVAVAALLPARRAGRLSAISAISVGRAPRAGRGFRLSRALTGTRLPLTVACGLGLPLARPSRAVATVVAVVLGAVTLVFAIGLATSVNIVQADLSRTGSVPVIVQLPRGPGAAKPGGPVESSGTVDPGQARATIAAYPGTAHTVAVSQTPVSVVGVSAEVTVEAYAGDATWTGYPLISGRWYANADEVVAGSVLLRQTGHHVGDRLVLTGANGQRSVTVVGEVLDSRNEGVELIADAATMATVTTVQPGQFEVGLAPGTDVAAYTRSLQDEFGPLSGVFVDDRTRGNNERTFIVLQSLIATLAVLLCTVAALGVLNTAVLVTRERAHQIGVFKSVGMTPRQVAGLVLIGMAALGLVAGVLAVPAGVLLHHQIVPIMADGASTGLPWSAIHVYQLWELVLLALAGVGVAGLGALLPARWAARSRPAAVLRAE